MIVVVGAGLIGLATAYELAKRGAEVRVIDAREPARAASWAGAGMLAPYTEAPASAAFARFCAVSLERYPSFVAELHERGGVDPRLHLDGILEVAFDEPQATLLRARSRAFAERGVVSRWIEPAELRMLEPALGARAVGAAFNGGEGQVDNRRLGRALVAGCAALGVRIDSSAGVVALEADPRRALGVRTKAGFVAADVVVNAAGAWAASLEGVPPHARVPVVPVKGQMLALALPRGFVRRVVWVPGAYLVPRHDGRLLVGATVEDEGFDVRVTALAMRTLLDAALEALPSLGSFALAETWAGVRPGTPDGLPYLGATALDGYVVACGHYRNGILLAPASAAAIADLLEGHEPEAVAAFSPRRAHAATAEPCAS